MFIVVGNQPSADVVRNIVKDMTTTEDVTVHWGARFNNTIQGFALNNIARCNALEQFDKFTENRLNRPEYTKIIDVAKRWEILGLKTFGRRLEHTRGNDIVGSGYNYAGRQVFNPRWVNRDFWVRIVPENHIINEWRIHVFQGRVIARGLKVQTGPKTRKMPVRSRNNGWTLTHDQEPPAYIREAARKAVAAVGYNFGAVDILETTIPPYGYCLLEVNSAPALGSDYTIEAYRKAFQKIAEGKYRKIYTPDEDPAVEQANTTTPLPLTTDNIIVDRWGNIANQFILDYNAVPRRLNNITTRPMVLDFNLDERSIAFVHDNLRRNPHTPDNHRYRLLAIDNTMVNITAGEFKRSVHYRPDLY